MDAIRQTLLSYPEGLRYFGLCFIVFLSSLGIAPGTTLDITLFVTGILISEHIFGLVPAVLIALFMVCVGESFVFELGQRLGSRVFEWKLVKRVVTPEKIERYRSKLQSSEKKAIRSVRFIPAFRPHSLLTVSALGLRRNAFYRYNLPLIVIHVLLVVLGAYGLTFYIHPTPGMIIGVLALIWVINWFTR